MLFRISSTFAELMSDGADAVFVFDLLFLLRLSSSSKAVNTLALSTDETVAVLPLDFVSESPLAHSANNGEISIASSFLPRFILELPSCCFSFFVMIFDIFPSSLRAMLLPSLPLRFPKRAVVERGARCVRSAIVLVAGVNACDVLMKARNARCEQIMVYFTNLSVGGGFQLCYG